MSNILMATPTIDTTESRFSEPTWVVKVNGSPNADATLSRVTLNYGKALTSAVFTVRQDPDTGTFPAYNDSIDVDVNGRNIFKGKIKGITSRISSSGLNKTFTALSNISTLQEKVVDPDEADFNAPEVRGKEIPEEDRLKADKIIQKILGYIPVGTPVEDPGELHLTDLTQLEAVEVIIRKLGNYRLFWNKDTDLLEIYRFGQGGDITRQFEKGVNILDFSITENRQRVVDKLTLIGPPRLLRCRTLVNTDKRPDPFGVYRLSFVINELNVRDIVVEGSQRSEPSVQWGEVEVSPADMGILPELGEKIAVWPFTEFSEYPGNAEGDHATRAVIEKIITAPSYFGGIGGKPVYEAKDRVVVFLSDIPKVWETRTIAAFVDNTKIGLEIGLEGVEKTLVEVLTRKSWFRGSVRATFTKDGDKPTLSTGSGPVERTLTDTQYQIIKDSISDVPFDNEADVLARMQERLDSEFEKVNRPNISGSITIPGDETVDLKSTVIVNSATLDVVSIVHNFQRGFTTTITLTNEPFFKLIAVPLPSRPTDTPVQRARIIGSDFTFSFQKLGLDQEEALQRDTEQQQTIDQPHNSIAILQD